MPPGNPGRIVRSLAALVLMSAAVLPAALEVASPAPSAVIGPPVGPLPDRVAPPAPHRLDLRAPGAAPSVDVRRAGDPANRITLVLLGDGYTLGQQALFREQADRAWRALMEIEPFRTYQNFFNIRRVEVVSPAAGIAESEDGEAADTPLGMHFWCEGTARLLCADEDATARYAGPDAGPQYLIALANSAEYGGAGGTGVTTLAGGSPDAGRIIQHEIGHTVGDLGDEYDSAPTDPAYANLSAVDAAEMLRTRTKWWRWLGATSPDGGGTVGAYRSANGLYRPTPDSVMRTLGGSYNLPSREAIVEQIYRRVQPLDGTVPAAGPVSGRPRLQVSALPLDGPRQLHVDWTVDGKPVPPTAAGGSWLDTATLGLPAGARATVTATVRDTTDWVRDEAFRDRYMTRTVSWTLTG
ncbi:M64 family metallopeptidase [Kitasatospora sp. NBC_01539]|uniref:M64 family metallopeptidase n=1 Tax=Kitasatospora sp. NBC_01539 TaxID=2903577 RepID=UPI0038601FFA